MPSYFVRQPNGRLAVFSTVVDNFTHVGMTEADALEWCRGHDIGETDALAGVRRGVDDTLLGMPGERRCCDQPGLYRWHDALTTILHCHGTAGLAKFLADHPEAYTEDESR